MLREAITTSSASPFRCRCTHNRRLWPLIEAHTLRTGHTKHQERPPASPYPRPKTKFPLHGCQGEISSLQERLDLVPLCMFVPQWLAKCTPELTHSISYSPPRDPSPSMLARGQSSSYSDGTAAYSDDVDWVVPKSEPYATSDSDGSLQGEPLYDSRRRVHVDVVSSSRSTACSRGCSSINCYCDRVNDYYRSG
jgi:hypothetical protein